MEILVEKMLKDFERGMLTRRQLAMSLTAVAIGLASGSAHAAAPAGIKAISLNHVTVHVPDLHKTSTFYQKFFGMQLAQQSETIHILSVGDSFFGIEQKPGAADLDHYDFGLANWNAAETRAKVEAAGLKLEPGAERGNESFKFRDPDGFLVQINGPKYTGHVTPASK
jgi:catechol 2,3-dioxygenase-like lactoylglutathione lyase family enzyme